MEKILGEQIISDMDQFGTGTVVVAENGKGEKVMFEVTSYIPNEDPEKSTLVQLVDLNNPRQGEHGIMVPVGQLLKGGTIECGNKTICFSPRTKIPKCCLDE